MADEEVLSEGAEAMPKDDAQKGRGSSRRSVSPYHQKCFPPYCDSATAVDKQAVSKMKRADLEDRYLVYADENLALKKRMKDHEKQIQRLTVALARQDQADRKSGVKKSYDNGRLDSLESQNKHLQAKVKVLTQQLMNHSFIHSKDNRIAEEKDRKRVSSPTNSIKEVNHTQSGGHKEDIESLKERIAAMEQMLEAQKKKYKTRISQLEKELAGANKSTADLGDQLSEHSKHLNDNLEMIKLKRQNKEQEDQIKALKGQLSEIEKEQDEIRVSWKEAMEKADDLEQKLKHEKEKAREAQTLVAKTVSHSGTIKELEEQVRDLQKEKEVLKDTNEKLLQLTTGPQSKSDKSLNEGKLKQEILLLEEKLKEKYSELEEKEEELIKVKALLEESKKQQVPETDKVDSAHNLEVKQLKEQLAEAQKEKEELKRTLEEMKAQAGNDDDQKLKDAQQENNKLRHDLETIKNDTSKENEELSNQLLKAQEEIESLKKQLAALEEMVPKSEYEKLEVQLKEVIKENGHLKEELEGHNKEDKKLQDQLAEALGEVKRLTAIAEEHAKEDKKLKDQLAEALEEVKRLTPIAEEHAKCQERPKTPVEVVRKDSNMSRDLAFALAELDKLKKETAEHKIDDKKLQDQLAEALEELKRLTAISEEHAKCLKNQPSATSATKKPSTPTVARSQHSKTSSKAPSEKESLTKKPSATSATEKPSTPKLARSQHSKTSSKAPSEKEVVHQKSSNKLAPEGYEDLKEQLCNALMENQKLRMLLEKNEHAPPKEVVVKDSKAERQLAAALAEVDRLNKIAAEHEHDPPKVVVVKDSKAERQLAAALAEVDRLNKIAAEHKNCPKHDSEHTYPSPDLFARDEVSLAYTKPPSPKPSPICLRSKERELYSQPMKAYSEYELQEIEPETAEKPVLMIVSKHQFDSLLLQKKKYYTENEVTVPYDEKEMLNCRMEICVYDLEVDNEMLDYLRNIEKDPHVYMDWSFLGLDQRTVSMPADRALFSTNVVYWGPLSQNMADHVKENVMPIYLMLVRGDGRSQQVAWGELDLVPAIKNIGRGFMRSINLTGDRGHATVHCSFKLHGCCPGEPPMGESIEVGIGHLELKNAEEMPDKSTHLYVEYSLLGHCGAELETDSFPKADIMRFNYTKRIRVNDHNVASLEPLLRSNNPQPLKFILLSEPCSLSRNTDVEELGTVEVNLMEEMVEKDKDLVSAHLPVVSKDGEVMGTLSLTIIGVDTLKKHKEEKKR